MAKGSKQHVMEVKAVSVKHVTRISLVWFVYQSRCWRWSMPRGENQMDYIFLYFVWFFPFSWCIFLYVRLPRDAMCRKEAHVLRLLTCDPLVTCHVLLKLHIYFRIMLRWLLIWFAIFFYTQRSCILIFTGDVKIR